MDSAGQQLTLSWLAGTFELFDGASVARREVYREYVEFCKHYNLNATTAAIFGKLVRMVFPTISSRRLGRRGANVVHYYNFRKKGAPSSPSPVPSSAAPPASTPSAPTAASFSSTGAGTVAAEDADQDAAAAAAGGGGIASFLPPPVSASSPSPPAPPPVPQSPIPVPFPPVPSAFSPETARENFPTFQPDQVMDDPYTQASSAQARVDAPPVDPSQLYVKPSPLWPSGEGAHLYVMALAGHFMHHYRHSYYAQCPLHPAALEENNVRYILCTKEGAEERSALSLNVYFALCLGAMISGHIPHARDFFQTTKEHLSHVFDMTDYSVAQALVPMGFQERFFACDEAEGWRVTVYYLTLANQICRRLGALASDVYSRCSKAVFFREDVDTDSQPELHTGQAPKAKSWEEIVQSELNFHEQIQQQKQSWLNYSAPRRTHKILYAILFAIVHLMDAMNNLEKLPKAAAQRKRPESPGCEEAEREQEEEYTKTSGGGRALARLLGLIAPKAAQEQSHEAANHEVAAGDNEDFLESSGPFKVKAVREKGLGRKDVARIAQYFTNQLLLLEEELLVLFQGTEIGARYLSAHTYNMTKLFIYGLRVENKWIAGDPNAALVLIMEFLEVLRRDKSNLMLFENKPIFQRVLAILREMGQVDVMHQMLDQLAPLASVSPIFSVMCDHFLTAPE